MKLDFRLIMMIDPYHFKVCIPVTQTAAIPWKGKKMIESSSQDIGHGDVIQPEMVDILAAKTEAERLQIAWGMWRSAAHMLQRIVTQEFPELSSADRQQIVARRMSHGT